ncbi:hypothetical protein MGA3_09745 [Bacillus methanolicus MGA3]|nr:hypothetical protein MGA3_09745 [Bacillus methanolicus MGA3]
MFRVFRIESFNLFTQVDSIKKAEKVFLFFMKSSFPETHFLKEGSLWFIIFSKKKMKKRDNCGIASYVKYILEH